MSIRLEAHVDSTHDGGLEFFDRVGAIVIHVDGEIVRNNLDAVKMAKIADSTAHLGPLYSIEIPESLSITVQCWKIYSVQQGRAEDLIEKTTI